MRKIIGTTVILIGISFAYMGCKSMSRAALKYWSKKQVKEFVSNCNEKLANNKLVSNAKNFCDCAVDQVAEKIPDYEKAKGMQAVKLLSEAAKCIKEN